MGHGQLDEHRNVTRKLVVEGGGATAQLDGKLETRFRRD